MQGRFVLGPRLQELASSAGEDRLLAAAMPVLIALRNHTKESTQLFRRQGDFRVCVAASEREMGLRDSIPVGATLTMKAGSAAQVLLAWEEPDRLHRGLYGATFNATMLAQVRRRGWAQAVAEREPQFLVPSSAWDANRDASTAPPRLRQPIGSLISSAPPREWKTKTRQQSRAGNTPPLSQ